MPVLTVDLNAAHFAAIVVDPSGNPVGDPATVPFDLAGRPAPTRDGRLRAAISTLLAMAEAAGCGAVAIENLDFDRARAEGKERDRGRPHRGSRGRAHRRMVCGLPTGRFRDRLVQMATNRGMAVIAVDPAYTSIWGARYWLRPLQQHSADATGHHSAAVVIGRRGLGQRARRREWCDSIRPADRLERATYPAVWPMPEQAGLARAPPQGTGTPHGQRAAIDKATRPNGPTAGLRRPGDPRPFGATRHFNAARAGVDDAPGTVVS
jgi:hypothetical protein